ncbi:hypothetical protein EJ06DRAFT_484305 [Trichodelitschia bisporula]|uniref:Uncharacterized protein n=1 Tax=Trichodelitschia bisporula TaxID=703511 RepID=A0A6G1HJ81_9PEZI|nr:hypothetical protein EJ06DRAFT_484305 [Trichodelitschia bisporula]
MHHSQDSSSQPAQGYGAVGVTSGSQGSTAAEVENAYSQYLQELRRTYEYVRDGRLAEAGTSLVQISDWLLGNAELLGLVRDEEGMHDERLKLWADFNRCWLVALQRQREMTIAMLDSGGQRPHPPESLMEAEQMETMGKELVRLCDMMEKHGLVDYQMGVWEEEIITFLGKCLDLLDEYSTQTSANGQATSSRRR